MATGSVKGERIGGEVFTAATVVEDIIPLPESKIELGFSYANKATEAELIKIPPHGFCSLDGNTFVELDGNVKPNSFLLADNFFGLQKLLESYASRITLIYLDPPYLTGKDFQSRHLKHAYNDSMDKVAYLEFMRRRLILLRELLSSEGSIYLHIGHQMLFHLKVIMDEVFGEKNFRNLIVRKKCSSKNYTRNQYANLNDYILFYSKGKNFKWNQPSKAANPEWIDREYPKVDQIGRYKLVPIHAPGIRKGETGKPWKGMNPPPGKHWQVSPAKLDQLDQEGLIHWSKNGNPRRKVYLPKDKQRPYTDYWEEFRDAHHQSVKITGYPTEKNLDMLKLIVKANSDEGDLVLDPFSGSGTTAHAANDLGRNWLAIDESFLAAETISRRFINGLEEMGDFVKHSKQTKSGPKARDLFEEKSNKGWHFLVDERLVEQHVGELIELVRRINS